MTLTFTEARIQDDGGIWLCLKVSEPAPARKFILELERRLYDLTVKPHREKRSLDANAYYWKLCGELAKATSDTTDNIYLRHIRDIANYDTLCMVTEAVPDFERRWKSGHKGRLVETRESKLPGCTTVLAYYGSSDFDAQEMSRLIDNCIQDCQAVGVETLPPDKLALLKEDWDAH
ncbi:MAG: NinB [Caudoviricetes sp.]|nr:MAG: NinB [Caudoviricetes sp.]